MSFGHTYLVLKIFSVMGKAFSGKLSCTWTGLVLHTFYGTCLRHGMMSDPVFRVSTFVTTLASTLLFGSV